MGKLGSVRAGISRGRLSEVRKKDPDINKAALFVEGLFDRPLQNDPKILNIGPLRPFVSHNGCLLNLPSKRWLSIQFPIRSRTALCFRESVAVHEITHSEDTGVAPSGALQKTIGFFKAALDIPRRIALEGRAVFAQHIHNGKIKRFTSHFWKMLAGYSILYASFFTNVHPLIYAVGVYYSVIGVLYWPFHDALCTLAKKVGDPVKAFRITTEKPPGVLGIVLPSVFYRKGIEAAKKKQEDPSR